MKELKALEKSLEERCTALDDNEVILTKEDFKNYKLTAQGYIKLKQECDLIPYREQIEIKVHANYEKGFKESLESLAANELARIKKDRFDNRIAALLLFLSGTVLFLLISLLEFFRRNIMMEVVIVAAWVFVWAACEKAFFDRRNLREKRFSLLHILSAKVTALED